MTPNTDSAIIPDTVTIESDELPDYDLPKNEDFHKPFSTSYYNPLSIDVMHPIVLIQYKINKFLDDFCNVFTPIVEYRNAKYARHVRKFQIKKEQEKIKETVLSYKRAFLRFNNYDTSLETDREGVKRRSSVNCKTNRNITLK